MAYGCAKEAAALWGRQGQAFLTRRSPQLRHVASAPGSGGAAATASSASGGGKLKWALVSVTAGAGAAYASRDYWLTPEVWAQLSPYVPSSVTKFALTPPGPDLDPEPVAEKVRSEQPSIVQETPRPAKAEEPAARSEPLPTEQTEASIEPAVSAEDQALEAFAKLGEAEASLRAASEQLNVRCAAWVPSTMVAVLRATLAWASAQERKDGPVEAAEALEEALQACDVAESAYLAASTELGTAKAAAPTAQPGAEEDTEAEPIVAVEMGDLPRLMTEAQWVLKALQHVEAVLKTREEALQRLRGLLKAEEVDLDAAQRELAQVEAAEAKVRSTGYSVPDKEEPQAAKKAREAIEVLLQRRKEAAAMRSLDGAISARPRNREALRAALAEAELAGVANSSPAQLAAELMSPTLPQQLLDQREVPRFGQLRLTVQDFVASAQEKAAALDEEALQKEVALLARAVKTQLQSLSAEVEQKVQEHGRSLLGHTASRAGEAVAFVQAALNESAAEETKRVSAEVAEEIWSQAHAQLESLKEEARAMTENIISGDSEELVQRLSALASPLTEVDTVVRAGLSPQQRMQASNSLSSALLTLEKALLEGTAPAQTFEGLQKAGEAAAGGGFMSRLLNALPVEVLENTENAVPTEPQLRRSFTSAVRSWTIAALTPPSEGLLGCAAAAAVGQVLGRMYKLGAADGVRKGVEGCPSEVVRGNLEALGTAAERVEKGDLLGALRALDALTGECRQRAAGWIAEARTALQLQQLARVAHAKVKCLNATLL